MKKIFILTGEPSGDKLASTVISKLMLQDPNIKYLSVAGNHIKKLGMLMGVYINILFAAVQLFHISTDAANFDAFGMIATLVFVVLFYWKCRPSS